MQVSSSQSVKSNAKSDKTVTVTAASIALPPISPGPESSAPAAAPATLPYPPPPMLLFPPRTTVYGPPPPPVYEPPPRRPPPPTPSSHQKLPIVLGTTLPVVFILTLVGFFVLQKSRENGAAASSGFPGERIEALPQATMNVPLVSSGVSVERTKGSSLETFKPLTKMETQHLKVGQRTPDTPASPDVPTTPDSPSAPDTPASPDSPSAPDSPSTPTSPTVPGSPALDSPFVPELPSPQAGPTPDSYQSAPPPPPPTPSSETPTGTSYAPPPPPPAKTPKSSAQAPPPPPPPSLAQSSNSNLKIILGITVPSAVIVKAFLKEKNRDNVSAANVAVFTNIDCKASSSKFFYNENSVVLTRDTDPIDNGESHAVQAQLATRIFFSPRENCYSISADKGGKILALVRFHYGNYYNIYFPPSFDIQIDRDDWVTAETSNDEVLCYETMYVVKQGVLDVCLLQTKADKFPFISAVEVRSLDTHIKRRVAYDTYASFI
ncbi:hypothetical protein RJ639_012602 [Escallonia herrerae]|uniref:Malectin-like domain-containing protein n=1 Tax=Escallonia herrerae TaxID=1293975 RepID=A0AA88VND4_9ASTE|nr:hypothetical protein RJ639_012602 [Escallonia herrerae]